MQIDKELRHTYSDNVTGKKILVLGPYPPPLGGVAVHVQRVLDKLKRQNNTVWCFDTTARNRWGYVRFRLYLLRLAVLLICTRPDHLMYNTMYLVNSLPELRLISFLQKFIRYKITYIEHDCRYMYTKSTAFKESLSALMRGQTLIMIGDSTYRSYVDTGIKLPQKSFIESAFLPPDESQELAIVATYPQSLLEFINSQRPLIVANAFQLALLDGKDLYGFDLCVEILYQLKQIYHNAGLVFALANIGDEQLYKKLCNRIEQLELSDHVYMLHNQKELWPLLKRADLFVRPTLSDSFGISIGEAIYFGTPAVASNVCMRPAGTILFRVGDGKDFYEKVISALCKGEYTCLNNIIKQPQKVM